MISSYEAWWMGLLIVPHTLHYLAALDNTYTAPKAVDIQKTRRTHRESTCIMLRSSKGAVPEDLVQQLKELGITENTARYALKVGIFGTYRRGGVGERSDGSEHCR